MNTSYVRITQPQDPQAATCLARCRSFYAADKDGRFGCMAACPTAETGDGDCAEYIVPGPQHCLSKSRISTAKTAVLVAAPLIIGFFAFVALVVVPAGR